MINLGDFMVCTNRLKMIFIGGFICSKEAIATPLQLLIQTLKKKASGFTFVSLKLSRRIFECSSFCYSSVAMAW